MTDPRQQIIDTCLALEARGLNQGTSGNISLRDGPDGFWLTPSGLPYNQLQPEDIVRVDLTSGTVTGRRNPSSEFPFHWAIMRQRTDATAVIHTHGRHTTAVACLRRDLPAIHYLIGLFGGSQIRCAPYATFGSDELSANVVAALQGRRAALMANHGLVVVGKDLDQALTLTGEAETLAQLYLDALAAGGPHLLTNDEINQVIEKFKAIGYGPIE